MSGFRCYIDDDLTDSLRTILNLIMEQKANLKSSTSQEKQKTVLLKFN